MNTNSDRELIQVNVQFRLDGDVHSSKAEIPSGRVSMADALPVIQSLCNSLVNIGVKRAEAEGKSISCRAGCTACCRQLIAISHAEAVSIGERLQTMPASQQLEVRQRFAENTESLRASGLWDRLADASNDSHEQQDKALPLDYFQSHLNCPFLKDDTCTIYQDRPLGCREYLVTSPAENCDDPWSESIDGIKPLVSLSSALMRFPDRDDSEPARFIPLPLLLAWLENHGDEPQPDYEGPEILQFFLKRFGQPER